MKIHLKKKPYIIAEIGINHNGYLSLAKKMIRASKNAGADAVKFQRRDVIEMINFGEKPKLATGYLSKNEKDIKKIKKKFGTWVYPDIRLELSESDYFELKKLCKKLKIDLIVTPWDYKSVEFVLRLNVKFIKIASIDANNYQFCEYIAKKNRPTIISTGMCTYDEILKTQKIFKKFRTPHIFLHCTSAYPSNDKDKNLSCIPVLRKKLRDDVGFSGHGTDLIGAAGATMLGANIIEKHVTLNKLMHGPDHAASLEFKEFSRMVEVCRRLVVAQGSSKKKFLGSETTLHNILIRKFIIAKNVKKNQKINDKNIKTILTYKKTGILPKEYYKILKKKFKKNFNKGHILKFQDIK
tara:strand:+ start:22613 stop:23671 length:1059 start_codon:yes stop_codon:yes gene_type:complete